MGIKCVPPPRWTCILSSLAAVIGILGRREELLHAVLSENHPISAMAHLSALQLFLALSLAVVTKAQFPKDCVTPHSLLSRECCPIGADGSPCNSRSLQGHCASHTEFAYFLEKTDLAENVRKDDRVHWPNKFYEKVCMCQGHFGGHDC